MSQLYTVRLESQTDSHRRYRTLKANGPDDAAARALALEGNRVTFDLAALKPVEQIITRRHAEGNHATLNLSHFAGSGLGGRDLLAYCERDHYVDIDGKAFGPNRRIKQYLAAHYQAEPFKVVAVDPVIVPSHKLIRQIVGLQGANPAEWQKVLEALRAEGIPLAAVTGTLYGLTAQKQIEGNANATTWTSDTIKVSLHTSAETPNQDTDDFWNDAGSEVTGTGYTTKGATLGSPTSTYDTTTDQVRLDGTDTSWSSSTITARLAVVYEDTAGADTTDPVHGWVDFGADVSTTNGTFQITWDSTGIINYDVS